MSYHSYILRNIIKFSYYLSLLLHANVCFIHVQSPHESDTKLIIKGFDFFPSLGIYSIFMQKALHKNFHLQPCLEWIKKDQRMNIFVSSRVAQIFL